ncbi:MAG: HEAT repeat domain-containing protein [Chloroflexi bacterium]|nr:HEAT repeat domain-containing protein [Chloroflexota bacterium]
MAKPNWETLVEQLHDPDPKVRRKACRRLAATRDPEVLPFIRNLYLQEEDERVREEAYQALAAFKALEAGEESRRLPISEDMLLRLRTGLVILLGVTLVLNILIFAIGQISSGEDEPEATVESTRLLAWDTLRDQMGERFGQVQEDAAALRMEIEQHNTTGQVACTASYHRPQPVEMSPVETETYSLLALLNAKLGAAILALQQPQSGWDRICTSQTASLTDGLIALQQLDQLDVELAALDAQLAQAAPPPPTRTPTPTITPEMSATPDLSMTEAQVPAMTEAAGDAPTSVLTPTLVPTATDTPQPTLPFPALDYTAILRDLSARFVVLGDLQNGYGNGMIDNWQKAQQGVAVTSCPLSDWPVKFTLTEAQAAELNREDAADPLLEATIRLVSEGLALANDARAIYEAACAGGTLADTAAEGIPLAEEARASLLEAQQNVETIRRR